MPESARTWTFVASASSNSDLTVYGTINWPDNVRYVVWTIVEENSERRMKGYIEFRYSKHKPVMKMCLTDAVFLKKTNGRDTVRTEILNAGNVVAGPWEKGIWQLKTGGESTRELREDLASLKEEVKQLLSLTAQQLNPASVTIVNNVTNVNNGIINNMVVSNVPVRDLGQEDLSDFPDDRLKGLILQMRTGLIEFIKETRFNPDKPENRNVRILSKKRNVAAVKKDGAWHQGSISQSLETALTRSLLQFFRPFRDASYLDHLIDEKPYVIDWHHGVMAKTRKEWTPLKTSARVELEKVYDLERRQNPCTTSLPSVPDQIFQLADDVSQV